MRALATAIFLLPALAAAQESLDDLDKAAPASTSPPDAVKSASSPIAEVNGYLSNRLQGTFVDPNAAPVSTRDTPAIADLLEANVQLKVHLGEHAFAYGDISVILQGGWLFYGSDGMGGAMQVDDHDVPSLRPFVAVNELYATWSPKPWLNLLAGKKRVVWGSGFAFNPTDLVNPPKDPTDPNFQRAGAWLARLELPFERFTISTLFVPEVLYQQNGLPVQALVFPSYTPSGLTPEVQPDDAAHYLLGARLYALVDDADVSLFYYFSNQFRDAFQNKSRLGASFSRYFFTDYELHVEALFQLGSARLYPNHACVAEGPFTAGCPDPIHDAQVASHLDSTDIYPRVLVGGRTMFKDESTLSVEYYYQKDGYSDLQLEDLVRELLAAQRALGMPVSGGMTTQGATPARFTFDPLRRHYLIASYSKPKIHDDWTASLTLILGLSDLSGVLAPTVNWSVRQWLTLSLYGFVPIRFIPAGQVTVDGKGYSEFGLAPFDARLMFEAIAYY